MFKQAIARQKMWNKSVHKINMLTFATQNYLVILQVYDFEFDFQQSEVMENIYVIQRRLAKTETSWSLLMKSTKFKLKTHLRNWKRPPLQHKWEKLFPFYKTFQ